MRLHLAVIVGVAFIIGGAAAMVYNLAYRGPAVPTQTSTGKAAIGGPFTLTDQTGKQVSDKSYAGKYMLVYFGYTFCPDVCPTELQAMVQALDELGPLADQVTPIFITIDPERDTVKQMASYVASFSPRLVGLSGTPEQVRKAAKAYRIYYAKVKEASSSDYLMDHSAFVYLMDRRGRYVTHFPYGTSPDKMAAAMRTHIVADKPSAALGGSAATQ